MALDSPSLTDRIFTNPLILSQILFWIAEDDWGSRNYYTAYRAPTDEVGLALEKSETKEAYHELEKECYQYSKTGVLFRCILVSRFWYTEGVRYLWRDIDMGFGTHKSLLLILERVAPERRQYYANFIKALNEYCPELQDADKWERLLVDLHFPRLESFTTVLSYDCFLPPLRNHKVEELVLDPSFDFYPDTYRVAQEDTQRILDAVQKWFPRVKSVRFIDRCLAWPGSLQKFQESMPSLTEFDYEIIMETKEHL